METPLEELIAGLDGLYEKATKGPWEADDEASIYAPVSVNFAIAHTGGKNWQERDSNAALIVALVNSYPRLRAHLKGRDEVIEQAAQIVEDHYWDSLAHGGIGKTHGAAIAKAIRALRNAAPEGKDAARYRWLRSQVSGQRDELAPNGQDFVLTPPDVMDGQNIMKGSVAQHLDDAIDAAIAAGEKS